MQIKKVTLPSYWVVLVFPLIWQLFIHPSYAQLPNTNDSGEQELRTEAGRLVNDGWSMFVGTNGVVDEFEALRLTAEGVQLARLVNAPQALSIGINNLGVIHMCAADARVRDYDFGRKVSEREVGKNDMSTDNFIWGVFLGKEKVDSSKFLAILKSNLGNHPVSRYVKQNNGRLPKTRLDALKILEREALNGDPEAAKWMAYQFECSKGDIDIKNAIFWFSLSGENAIKKNLSELQRWSIDQRRNRLAILEGMKK
jgi:hypothetical protein